MRIGMTMKWLGGAALAAGLLAFTSAAFSQTAARLLPAEDESVAPQLQPTRAVRPDTHLRPTDGGSSLNVVVPAESPKPTPTESLRPTPTESLRPTPTESSRPTPTESSRPTLAKRPQPTSAPKLLPTPSAPPAVPAPAAPARIDVAALEPIPDSLDIGKIKVETAAFNSIMPGKSTTANVEKAWGEPKESRKQGNTLLHLYTVEPFERIEVGFREDKVVSIVIRLQQTLPAKTLAEQLKLDKIRPALVLSDLGEILGQVYPERGVLFSLTQSDTEGTDTLEVAEIIIEPVNAEAFALRAESNFDTDPRLSLPDVREALKIDRNSGQALWLYSRILASEGNYEKAAASASRAVQIEPRNVEFRLAWARFLGHIGQMNEAIQESKRAIELAKNRPHLKARSLCLTGDLLASGEAPNYGAAIKYHTNAVKAADPMAGDRRPAIRLAVKEVLVDAHLGAAHDIAWGKWKQKDKAVAHWLRRAKYYADDLVEIEGATEDHRFRVASRALAACVGVRGGLDPANWTNMAVTSGRKLLTDCDDPHRKAQLEWDLGMVLYDALQVCQMREDQAAALTCGKKAVEYLTMTDESNRTAAANYLLGRLYFRLGTVYAMTDDNHDGAVVWFDKAVPLLQRPIPEEALPDLGRHGETFVSMAVSYWGAGQRDKALDLTQAGVELMKRAVRLGYLHESALTVPYANLATMHRQIGNERKALEFDEMATKLNSRTQLQ